jgi:hypothetical protein
MIRSANYGRAVCVGCLTVTARPMFTSIDPPSLAAGTQHATLTVTGSGFQTGLFVGLGERGITTESVEVTSDTEAIVTASVADWAEVRHTPVVVRNADHGFSRTPNAFEVTGDPHPDAVTRNVFEWRLEPG